MVGVLPLRVISLRRVLRAGAGLAGAVLTLVVTLRAGTPGWDGPWPDDSGQAAIFTLGPAPGDTLSARSAAPSKSGTDRAGGFGEVTLVVVPRDSSMDATLYRDGLAAGRFDGGPLTLAVRRGDVLSVRVGAGDHAATVRVIGASAELLRPRSGEWVVGAGASVSLPPVRVG